MQSAKRKQLTSGPNFFCTPGFGRGSSTNQVRDLKISESRVRRTRRSVRRPLEQSTAERPHAHCGFALCKGACFSELLVCACALPCSGRRCVCANVSLVSVGAPRHVPALPAWGETPGCLALRAACAFGGPSANQRRRSKILSSSAVDKSPPYKHARRPGTVKKPQPHGAPTKTRAAGGGAPPRCHRTRVTA